jgi:O-antigen ligase
MWSAGKHVKLNGFRETLGPMHVRQFWVLAAFLCLIFLTGGSTWPDEPQLIILRPVAILVAAYALLTMRSEQWRRYKAIWLLLGAILALVLLHLIPLPPQIWKQLPGREILARIDEVAGLHSLWRPLSMVPDATLNAAYSLAVPIAVALLAAQLDALMHNRLLVVILALSLISAAVGLTQAAGTNWHFYSRASETAGLFINRNHQAALLALILPMLGGWAAAHSGTQRSNVIVQLASVAAVIITLPLLIITGSRMGLLLGALGLASVPLFWLDRMRQGSVRAARNTLMAAGGILIVIVIGLLWITIAASRATAIDRLKDTESIVRLPAWSSIVDMLGQYLPWGSGIGSYERVYQILEPASLLEPYYSNHAHNEWLEIMLTAGIPGIVLLVVAGAFLVLAVWRGVRLSGIPALYSRLGVAAIIILAFASSVDYSVRTPILSAFLALAAIWAASYRRFGTEVIEG